MAQSLGSIQQALGGMFGMQNPNAGAAADAFGLGGVKPAMQNVPIDMKQGGWLSEDQIGKMGQMGMNMIKQRDAERAAAGRMIQAPAMQRPQVSGGNIFSLAPMPQQQATYMPPQLQAMRQGMYPGLLG